MSVLYLEQCPRLRSLPEEIQNFKNLNKVTIKYCVRLFERYNKETGVDWPKISGIPCFTRMLHDDLCKYRMYDD